jgi:hypothetical protein
MNKRMQRIVLLGILLAAGIGGALWWQFGLSRSRSLPQTQSAAARPEQPLENATSQTPSEAEASAPFLIDDVVARERERRTHVELLLEKSVPLVPTLRAQCMRFVAERSLEQVARDLGDIQVMEYCRNRDVAGLGMDFWATAVPPNLLFLRLVEEGREAPDRVSGILCESIRKKLTTIAEIRKQQDSAPDRPTQGDYSSAVPAQFAIAAAFCALANIDRLDDPEAVKLLDAWIAAPQPIGYEAREIQLWLIDQYFGSLDASADPHAATHREIANGRTLVTAPRAFSKWHQPYDLGDPFILDRSAVEGLETLEVLGIATTMPFTFREMLLMRENSHDHVTKLTAEE